MNALRIAANIAGGPAGLARLLTERGYPVTGPAIDAWLYRSGKRRKAGFPPPQWIIPICAAVDYRVKPEEFVTSGGTPGGDAAGSPSEPSDDAGPSPKPVGAGGICGQSLRASALNEQGGGE